MWFEFNHSLSVAKRSHGIWKIQSSPTSEEQKLWNLHYRRDASDENEVTNIMGFFASPTEAMIAVDIYEQALILNYAPPNDIDHNRVASFGFKKHSVGTADMTKATMGRTPLTLSTAQDGVYLEYRDPNKVHAVYIGGLHSFSTDPDNPFKADRPAGLEASRDLDLTILMEILHMRASLLHTVESTLGPIDFPVWKETSLPNLLKHEPGQALPTPRM